MINNRRAVDLIETALDRTPFCACGETATIVSRHGSILLECPTLSVPRGPMGRLLDIVLSPAHVSEVVVDAEIGELAA